MEWWTEPLSPEIWAMSGVGTTSWFRDPASTAVRVRQSSAVRYRIDLVSRRMVEGLGVWVEELEGNFFLVRGAGSGK